MTAAGELLPELVARPVANGADEPATAFRRAPQKMQTRNARRAF